MKLVVIIPAYNEEASIGNVIKRIPKINERISKTEVIVIDDGSKDKTSEIAQASGAYVVSHVGNKGVGRAFQTGIEEALKRKADIIVNIDADGQFNPEDIPFLVKPILNKEADFVTATRFKDGNLIGKMPWIKKIGNKIFTKLTSVLVGQKFTDTQCLPYFSKIFCLIDKKPFYGSFRELKKKLTLEKSGKNIYNIKENVKVYSLNEDKKLELAPVSQFVIINDKKKLLKIRFKGGRETFVSEDHPLLFNDFSYRKAKELKIGERIPLVKEVRLDSDLEKFDLIKLFSETKEADKINVENWKQYYGESSLDISNEYNTAQQLILRDVLPLNIFVEKDVNNFRDGITLKYFQGRNSISSELELNNDFMKFLGYYISEGCSDSSRASIRFSFNKTEIEMINEIKNIIKNFFDLNYDSYFTQECEVVCVYNKLFCLLLEDIFKIGNKAKNKRIPDFLFGLSKEKIGIFLDTYLKGDGHIRQEPDSVKIYCNSASKDLIYGLQLLLLRLGVTSSIQFNLRGGNINGRDIKKTPRWTILIHGGSNTVKLSKRLPSLEKYKIRQFDSKYSNKEYSGYFDKNSINEDLAFSEIISVGEVDYEDEWYDLKIQSEEKPYMNFMHDNGIISHNCGFRSYSREAALRLNLYGRFTYTQEVFLDLANKGLKIKEVPLYVKATREFGKSKVVKSVPKYVFQALAIIIRSVRDYQPFTFFGAIGGGIFGLGALINLILFIRWLIIGKVSPYVTLVSVGIVLMILGFLLLVLALIADMLDRQRRIEEDLLYMKKKEMFE